MNRLALKLALAIVCSLSIGVSSGLLAGAFPPIEDAGVLYSILSAWLYQLPVAVDLWLLPEGDENMLMLAMAVLSLQYFVVIICFMAAGPLATILSDFIRGPKHRSGLGR